MHAAHGCDDTDDVRDASETIVSGTEWQAEQYRRTLHYAEAAYQLEPDHGRNVHTLGAVLFRQGRYAEALATLTRAAKLNAVQHPESVPLDLAYLAMTCHKLGQRQQAQHYLQRLRGLRQLGCRIMNWRFLALLAEAEALCQRRSG
jgi:tetratricopeptide (TPR) repeat protein